MTTSVAPPADFLEPRGEEVGVHADVRLLLLPARRLVARLPLYTLSLSFTLRARDEPSAVPVEVQPRLEDAVQRDVNEPPGFRLGLGGRAGIAIAHAR